MYWGKVSPFQISLATLWLILQKYVGKVSRALEIISSISILVTEGW